MLRRHGRIAATLPVVALAIATGVLVVLWSPALKVSLLAWYMTIALAIGVQELIHARLVGRIAADPTRELWLHLYRLGALCHGIAWGGSSLLLENLAEGVLHQALLLSVLTVVAAVIVVGSFDLVALAVFCLPAVLPSTWHFLRHEATPLSLLALLLAGSAAAVAAVRNRRNFLLAVEDRQRQQQQDQQRALAMERLHEAVALAGVSGWEYDPRTQTVHIDENTRTAMRVDGGAPEPLAQLLARLEPDSALALERAIEHSCRTSEPMKVEVVNKARPDPSLPRVVLLSGGAVVDKGRVVRLTGTMQDMTALRAREKEVADQARLLQQLVQNTSQGMWFLDNEGRTTDVNDAMSGLLGRTRQEVLGRSVMDFFADADLAILLHQLELRKRGHREGYEIGITRPDGTRVQCFNNATPLYDAAGQKVGSVGMWTDLTPLKTAMQRAEHSRLELFALLDAFPGFVTAVDDRGRYTFMNRRMADWYKLDPKQVMGLPITDGVSHEHLREARDWAEKMDAGQVLVEVSLFQQPGEPEAPPRWLQTTRLAGAPTPEGRRQYYSFGTDITALKEAEAALSQREAELRTALEVFPGAVAVVDADLRYRYVNRRMSELVGRPTDSLVGVPVQDVLPPERTRQLLAELPRLDAGEVMREELVLGAGLADPEGKMLELTRVAGPPLASGKRNYFSFAVDITQARLHEAKITAALQAAEAASRAKSEFLSQVSHELRTPLNAIVGFAQLLQTDREQPLSPSQGLQVHEMLNGARHLLDLINGLLDMGRIESGQFSVSMQPVPLKSLLQECFTLVAPVAQRQGIVLELEPCEPPSLAALADRTRLTQIMVNLLGNAIKYNRPQGHVRVRVVPAQGSGRVTVEVTDTGLGLTAQEQTRLFEPFQRLRAEGSGVEGTGIGLALSRRLAQAMSGDISVRSTPGEGSVFSVELDRATAVDDDVERLAAPEKRSDDVGKGGEDASSEDAPRGTVLCIEDNPVNAMVMEAMVARLPGVRMLHAEDGVPGLNMALTHRPQLILTDIQMPGMDGFTLLKHLREQELTRHIPVVAITADATVASLERGRSAGFDDYLTKPVQMEELHTVLRRLLAPSRPSGAPGVSRGGAERR